MTSKSLFPSLLVSDSNFELLTARGYFPLVYLITGSKPALSSPSPALWLSLSALPTVY